MNEDELNIILQNEEEELNIKLKNDVVGTGTSNYEELKNKPKINEIELIGNKSFEDLGLIPMSNTEIENLFKINRRKK